MWTHHKKEKLGCPLLATPVELSDRRLYYDGMGAMDGEGIEEVPFCAGIVEVVDAEGMDMGGVPVCADMVGAMDASVPQSDNSYVVFPILSWTLNSTGTGTFCDTQ
jgi:hypothetical protein